MNLRAARIRLTLVYGVLSAIAIGALAYLTNDAGRSSILASAEREALFNVTEVLEEQEGNNAWFVSIADDAAYEEPLPGEQWIEPPLITITQDALWYGDEFPEFESDGTTYLGAVRPVDDEAAIVAFIDRFEFDQDAADLRNRIALGALGAVIAVAGIGWWVAGRSLRPTRRVLAQQRDFIADAAHELRTPLAVIQASASQTLSRPREAEQYREALEEIADAADRASGGVNELLEFARLEAGQALPRLAPLRLDFLAEEVVASIRVDDVEIAGDLNESVVVSADHALIRQAVTTVVNNAAARAEHVVLTVTTRGKHGVITISDDGPGFSDEALAHLFDRFHRGDRSGATGLGMAIAKKIVDVHRGTIEAGNGGGGAVVSIALPLADSVDR